MRTRLQHLLLAAFLVAQGAISPANASPQEEVRPIWLIPAFADVPTDWQQKVYRTDDSQGISLRKGIHHIQLEYGFSTDAPGCKLSDFSAARSISALTCGDRRNGSLLFIVRDPSNDGMELFIWIHDNPDARGDRSSPELEILRSIKFVGDVSQIQLIGINPTRLTATLRYENGSMRTVHVGDIVARDFGIFVGYRDGGVLVTSVKQSADGEWLPQTFLLAK